jgi:hypothetical protein
VNICSQGCIQQVGSLINRNDYIIGLKMYRVLHITLSPDPPVVVVHHFQKRRLCPSSPKKGRPDFRPQAALQAHLV